jgi:formylmethanofuran dehydrogenase subunit E
MFAMLGVRAGSIAFDELQTDNSVDADIAALADNL